MASYTTLTKYNPGDNFPAAQWNLGVDNFTNHEDRITQNESDISSNTTDIATNTSNIASIGILHGFIAGLEISIGTDTNHDIDIAVGQAADSDNDKYLVLASSITKQIDATWAKGTNAGGLDTGSVANATFYYFWIIEQDSTNDIDILISASATSPTMPAGWTEKRRIRGAVLTDGSANILPFRQKDNNFRYTTMLVDVADGTSGTSRNTAAVSVPPNFIGIFYMYLFNTSTTYSHLAETTDVDYTPDFSTGSITNVGAGGNLQNIVAELQTDASSQITYRTSASSIVYIYSQGFIDNAQ